MFYNQFAFQMRPVLCYGYSDPTIENRTAAAFILFIVHTKNRHKITKNILSPTDVFSLRLSDG